MARGAALGIAAVMVTSPAQAAFHLWNIREIYTDPSGSVQFIEFFCTFGGQQFVGGQQVQVVNVGASQTHTFMIPANLPSTTANHAFLIGTSGLQAAGGPAPDYVMPNNFLFAGGGTLNFFGQNSGAYTALPVDGTHSRVWADGDAVNSPQNFAGATGFVNVPEPGVWGLLVIGSLSLWFLLRRRSS